MPFVTPFKLCPSHCPSDPSALRLSFFGGRTPCASPLSTHPSFRGAWKFKGVPRVGSREVSPPSCHSVGGGGLDSVGASDSAASSLPGVGVVGSSRSQESLVLADPSPVASSVSAGCDCRSRSRKIGESTGDRSRSFSLVRLRFS